MKKMVRLLALALIAILMFSCTAFAANADPQIRVDAEGVSVAFADVACTKVNVECNDSSIAAGGLYMIFVVKANENDAYVPTESTILYLNQVQATENGRVSFSDVFLSKVDEPVDNCAVMISGTGLVNPVILAYIEVPYVRGDANEDGAIDTKDLTRLARYLAGATNEINLNAADANADETVDTKDLTRLARYLAGAATLG